MQNFGQFLEASVSADLVGRQLHRRPPDRNQAGGEALIFTLSSQFPQHPSTSENHP